MFSKGTANFITKKFITGIISQTSILKHYFNIHEFGKLILSPLREDKVPSFKVTAFPNGDINYYDFGTGDSGDAFKMVSKKFGLDFNATLDMIYSELILKNNKTNVALSNLNAIHSPIIQRHNKIIKVKTRKIHKYDVEYWKSQGIYNFLKYGMYPISLFEIIDIDKNIKKAFKADKYSYAYYENKDNKDTFKIYQPFSDVKWLSDNNDSVWELWNKLPKFGDDVLITSSRKDSANIIENFNIPATSLQSEKLRPKEHVIQELKNRFKRVHILYDNDFDKEVNVGYETSLKLSKEFDLNQLVLPNDCNQKDPTDLFCFEGESKYHKVMMKLFNNHEIKFNYSMA